LLLCRILLLLLLILLLCCPFEGAGLLGACWDLLTHRILQVISTNTTSSIQWVPATGKTGV
jgi:hypothetical protein